MKGLRKENVCFSYPQKWGELPRNVAWRLKNRQALCNNTDVWPHKRWISHFNRGSIERWSAGKGLESSSHIYPMRRSFGHPRPCPPTPCQCKVRRSLQICKCDGFLPHVSIQFSQAHHHLSVFVYSDLFQHAKWDPYKSKKVYVTAFITRELEFLSFVAMPQVVWPWRVKIQKRWRKQTKIR